MDWLLCRHWPIAVKQVFQLPKLHFSKYFRYALLKDPWIFGLFMKNVELHSTEQSENTELPLRRGSPYLWVNKVKKWEGTFKVNATKALYANYQCAFNSKCTNMYFMISGSKLEDLEELLCFIHNENILNQMWIYCLCYLFFQRLDILEHNYATCRKAIS